MKKDFPFMDLRVHYEQSNPDPMVKYIAIDESSGSEVVKELPASLFYHEFPLAKDEIKLQEYLDSGVPLREVPCRLYESNDMTDYPFSQEELYQKVESIVNEYQKEEV